MKRKLNDVDWRELFQGIDVETFLKLSNNIILKYTPRFTFHDKLDKQSSLFESSV